MADKIIRVFNGILLLALFAAVAAPPASAFPPPRPGIFDPLTQRFRTTGHPFPSVPEAVRAYRREAPLGGKYPLAARPKALKGAAMRPLAVDPRTASSVRPLVLLVDFDDMPASGAPAIQNKAVFDSLFFGSGPSDLSVKNYWEEQSYTRQGTHTSPGGTGRTFTVAGSGADIYGWLRAGRDFQTTVTSFSQIAGVQPGNVSRLIADAVSYLQAQGYDLSPYVGPNGTFQAVIVVHPGYGQEDTGDNADPYSHTAPIDPAISVPGVGDIVDYSLVPALQSPLDPSRRNRAVDPRIGVGVIVHEMGHLLGLPDLYPTAPFGQVSPDNVFSGAGVFDLMAYGLWGSNLLARPDIPAHLSAWSKAFLGWLDPYLVSATQARTLRPVEFYPEADKILSNTAADPKQYFLVENRQTYSPVDGEEWIFDLLLPGAGALVWQIDEEVIDRFLVPNEVNNNPKFRGVYVKEADGVADMAAEIVGATPNDRARFFGDQPDYFSSPGQVFDRASPSAAVNSSPVVDNTYTFHPVDFGAQIQLLGFTRTATNALQYVANLSGAGAGEGPLWKTFNVAGTRLRFPDAPMRSDDILSIAFDSGNNVWLGSKDQGIFRFLGTRFDILTAVNSGLPSGSGTSPVARIQALAFENDTGSMWVGTDRGVFKMRDAGSGFRVVSSFTETSAVPRKLPAGGGDVRALAVRPGFALGSARIDIKYAATPAGLVRIDDQNTDAEAGDFVSVIKAGDATAVAVDDGGTPATAADDIVWAGFSDGKVFRSLRPGEGGPSNNDPVADSHFKQMLDLGSRITVLAVDNTGRLWIGTESRGVLVFDLGEPDAPNLEDPYDFDGDTDTALRVFWDAGRGLASNRVGGIAFQAATGRPGVVAWIACASDGFHEGGASRFDAGAADDPGTPGDERMAVFRPEAGVPPENQTQGPCSVDLSCAAADAAGNVWFGSTAPGAAGACRFGNAGVLSLDRTNYVNLSAVATVTLQDDGLNLSDNVVNVAVVRVKSSSDPTGIFLIMTETSPVSGVFQARFGFTAGASDTAGALPLLHVASGDTVTVTYEDFQPRGTRTATATWKKVFPFSDSLWIPGGCFIATAAWGSPMAPEVALLRAFRDRFLLPHLPGRLFVAAYYRLSPRLAAAVAPVPVLRAAARFALAPAVILARLGAGDGASARAAALCVLGCAAVLAAGPGRRGSRPRRGMPRSRA